MHIFILMLGLSFLLVVLILIPVSQQNSMNSGDSLLPLESGFWCLSGAGTKFSMQFFTVLIIFVLFDVEIILLAPVIFSLIPDMYTFFFILFFIGGTLLLEWWWGKLTWFD